MSGCGGVSGYRKRRWVGCEVHVRVEVGTIHLALM